MAPPARADRSLYSAQLLRKKTAARQLPKRPLPGVRAPWWIFPRAGGETGVVSAYRQKLRTALARIVSKDVGGGQVSPSKVRSGSCDVQDPLRNSGLRMRLEGKRKVG